ncbi:uncharacterized protein LOC127797294 isoform X3 [Diospyros lotus]|uniref:uncharacterized protein LOC127797294 isoform X3 n=1 Tax=Diospyros lotus TaxID=55363 RepID=UPI00225BCB0B|nr:uncharacterized protein LOC127797294 isoform X3 [Diospyros lotus]
MGYSDRNSYYGVLGVAADCSEEEIRRAYRKLAMQWHPDKWARKPSLLGEAKRKFQQIQEAYSVLSDKRTRTMYDAGLFDPEEEYDEVRVYFASSWASLTSCKKWSLLWIRLGERKKVAAWRNYKACSWKW